MDACRFQRVAEFAHAAHDAILGRTGEHGLDGWRLDIHCGAIEQPAILADQDTIGIPEYAVVNLRLQADQQWAQAEMVVEPFIGNARHAFQRSGAARSWRKAAVLGHRHGRDDTRRHLQQRQEGERGKDQDEGAGAHD